MEEYTIKVLYKVASDFIRHERILSLCPDRPLNIYYNGPFKWIGTIYLSDEILKIEIHQKSIHVCPDIDDINIDNRIIINKFEIINKIEENL